MVRVAISCYCSNLPIRVLFDDRLVLAIGMRKKAAIWVSASTRANDNASVGDSRPRKCSSLFDGLVRKYSVANVRCSAHLLSIRMKRRGKSLAVRHSTE